MWYMQNTKKDYRRLNIESKIWCEIIQKINQLHDVFIKSKRSTGWKPLWKCLSITITQKWKFEINKIKQQTISESLKKSLKHIKTKMDKVAAIVLKIVVHDYVYMSIHDKQQVNSYLCSYFVYILPTYQLIKTVATTTCDHRSQQTLHCHRWWQCTVCCYLSSLLFWSS